MPDFEATLLRFQRQTEKHVQRWWGRQAIIETERRYNYMKIRIQLDLATFIELYANAQNGRGSYALIHRQQRIFGYDGVTRWHRHPSGGPNEHEPCRKPRLAQALREMKQIVESRSFGEKNVRTD